MTEEEAKTKWCPHAVASHTDPRAGFHDDDSRPKVFPCIGSACMAFRWNEPDRECLRLYEGDPRRETAVSAGTMWIVDGNPWRYEYSDCDAKGKFDLLHRARPEDGPHRTGYCGLAGRP